MLYAQISSKDSLRDIQNSFAVQSSKLYHIGLQAIKRSTLADAKQHEITVARSSFAIVADSMMTQKIITSFLMTLPS